MKTVISLTSLIGLLALMIMTDMIGFHYPVFVDGEPLNDPVKVIKWDVENMHLEDGRIIAIKPRVRDMAEYLRESNSQIELGNVEGHLLIWGRKRAMICGTRWFQTIRIPLIPDKVALHWREVIAFGTYVDAESPTGN